MGAESQNGLQNGSNSEQLVLIEKQGTFQQDYSSPCQTGEVFFCSFYEYASETKAQFWLRKRLSSNSIFSHLFIAFLCLNK